MSKHDQAALDAATQIIDLFSSPGQWRDTWHLKHKVQCLLIDLLERNATQPAAGEPVAPKRCATIRVNRLDSGRYAPKVMRFDAGQFPDGELIDVYTAPPAAAHGDEAVRFDSPEALAKALFDHGSIVTSRLVADRIFAAMRAQGDEEVQ